MNYGNKVTLKYHGTIEILRNVTEIHFGFNDNLPQQIAFESSIHGTGITVFTSHIKEFETKLEANKAEAF